MKLPTLANEKTTYDNHVTIMAEEVTQEQTQSFDEPFLDSNRLIYAGRDCYLIPEELYKYGGKVNALDLSFNCIKDLEGLEHFAPSLEELILDNNEVCDQTSFPDLPKLTLLSLCKNKIDDFYSIVDSLHNKVPKLRFISMLGNRGCPDSLSSSDNDETDYSNYRKYLVYRFPTLKFIDSKPVTTAERKDAQKQGPFLRVIRPQSSQQLMESQSIPQEYNPLPTTSTKSSAGVYKKSKYIYHGKHSEGNRFIRNNDL